MVTISIITAVRNESATIRDSIESIRRQSHPVEHIIIDGASNDATLEIIRESAVGAVVVSEPDKGFYDALNKGLRIASGDIIGILNANDFYADTEVLARVAEVLSDSSIDSCYGDLFYVDEEQTDRIVRCWRSGTCQKRSFYQGWMPPHPTFFVRRQIYETYGGFNTAFGTAADYELMLRFLVKHRITTAYIPHVLVKMRMGGQSNASWRNRLRANRMDRLAWKANGLRPYPWTLVMKPLRKVGQFFIRK